MALYSKEIKTLYYSPKSEKPTIKSPKREDNWQEDKTVIFEWGYNGFDLQLEYTLQILKVSEQNIPSSVLEAWEDTDSSSTISPEYIIEYIIEDTRTRKILDLGNDLSGDGVFRWRIKVKGVISQEYSDWDNSGYLRIDSSFPFIKNASLVTPALDEVSFSQKAKLAATISDFSSPFIRTRRGSDSGYDAHIERDGDPGLYIYYDYRDHSIVLRCQNGNKTSNPKQRFYGLMSFHQDVDNPYPAYKIQDAIKMGYVYKINTSDGSESIIDNGPYHETFFTENKESNLTNPKIQQGLDKIINIFGAFDREGTDYLFVPRNFPAFWQGSILDNTRSVLDHAATIDSFNKDSFFSVFPFNTKYVRPTGGTGRTLKFPLSSTNSIYTEFIELRYPAPFHDVFVYFNTSFNKVLAYGRYSSMEDVNYLSENPNASTKSNGTAFEIQSGFDVQASEGPANLEAAWQTLLNSDERLYQVFHQDNTDLFNRTNLVTGLREVFAFQSGESYYPIVPASNYLYFNLVPDDDGNDVAIKFYLNDKILKSFEQRFDASDLLKYFEFYMYPEADCALAYKGGDLTYSESIDYTDSSRNQNKTYKMPISIDQIYIGRSRISPRDLPMFDIDLETASFQGGNKQVYRYIKYPNEVVNVGAWSDDQYFQNVQKSGTIEYNGSFRLEIPTFKFIPYYHPNTALYNVEDQDVAPAPYIYYADPNNDDNDNIINWDSIELRTSSLKSYEPNSRIKSDFIYSSDFIKIEGGAQYYGQANPHYYNHEDLEALDYKKGTISRIKGMGWICNSNCSGDLAFTLFERGWSPDSVWYNTIDRGFYGIAESFSNINFIESSLCLFVNGQQMIGESGIISGNEITSQFIENSSNLHEFYFSNIGVGGLNFPPRNDDKIMFMYRSLGNFYEGAGYTFKTHVVETSSLEWNISGFGSNIDSGIDSSVTYISGTLNVYINGILLEKNKDYTESSAGDKFTFLTTGILSEAPAVGTKISIQFYSNNKTQNQVLGPFHINYDERVGSSASPLGPNDDFETYYTYSIIDDFGQDSSITIADEESGLKTICAWINGILVYATKVTDSTFRLYVPKDFTLDSEDIITILFVTEETLDIEDTFIGANFITPKSASQRYSVRESVSEKSLFNEKLRLRDFSNLLYRDSVRVLTENPLTSEDLFVDSIVPVSSSSSRTYIWNNGSSSILNDDINELSTSNGPSWVQYKSEGDAQDVADFVAALSASDDSYQGYYGSAGASVPNWTLNYSNLFAGYYLIEDTEDDNSSYEQIKRSIIGQSRLESDNSETLFVRGPFAKNIDQNTLDNKQTQLSGDMLSMGNIFGIVNPSSTASGNTVKVSFDIEESTSAINGIKYFTVDLDVDAVDVDGDFTNLAESSHFWGAKDSNGNLRKMKILMQRLNNQYFSQSNMTSALEYLSSTRSPISLIENYFDQNLNVWTDVSESLSSFLGAEKAGYGKRRFSIDIPVSGSGYKLMFVQLRDRAENISNIYCIPFAISPASQITSQNKVDNAQCNVDEDIITRKITATKDSVDYIFEEDIIPRDNSEFRSIFMHSILSETTVTQTNSDGSTTTSSAYREYPEPQNLLLGMSDNYGLSYNGFFPFTSVKSWRFDRPIAIPMKSFKWWDRGPEWYFDPNDIRHYTPDTPADFVKGISSNNNIPFSAFSGHIPGNGTLSPITLVGLRATTVTSDTESWGKTNPIADKIYEFREEFIGKKLILGADLSQSFTILHVFKTSNLASVKRWATFSEEPISEIDGDSFEKVWIVLSDPDAIAALILSRKAQYADSDLESSDFERFNIIRGNLGTKEHLTSNYYRDRSEFSETENFGYYEEESSIPGDVNDIVNSALGMSGNISDGFYPANTSSVSNTVFYLAPSESFDLISDIDTSEGWVCQTFKAFDPQARTIQSAESIADSVSENHYQLLGLSVLDRMVFGEGTSLESDIESYELISASDEDGSSYILPTIFLSGGRIDKSMVGRNYLIINKEDMSVLSSGIIQRVNSYSRASGTNNYGNQGAAIVLEDEIDISGGNYKIYVSIDPLQTIDPDTGINYTTGWWPNVDGILIPPLNQAIGYVNSANKETSQGSVRFVSIFNGAFYVKDEDDYTFLLEANNGSYLDMSIDYMRSSGLVEDIIEDWDVAQIEDEIPTSVKIVGGRFEFNFGTTSSQSFRLKKGWHTARIRYVSRDQAESFGKNTLKISYRKSEWPSGVYVPFTGSLDDNYSFMAKSYRSVHAKILDENLEEYPLNVLRGDSPDRSKASQYCRAIVGFFESLVPPPSGRYKNQIVQVDRFNDSYGSVTLSVSPAQASVGTTYGGQMFEEAFGIYESSIIDGGFDFRFWRTISWSPSSQPENTSVKFQIRTAPTEEELLIRTWNNVGSESSPNILDPFEVPGTDILEFSQQTVGVSIEDIEVNRFLQFRMVLGSRVRGVTPTVNDVTILYSKLNSVNFFTTTFDLNSNILRALLSYNGSIPEDPSGFAVADIQFGISTKETSNGIVSTNFDDYAIIPLNEAFSLEDLGIKAAPNDKFRIGIKFISTENAVPTVNEFGMMWETEGKSNRTIDFL